MDLPRMDDGSGAAAASRLLLTLGSNISKGWTAEVALPLRLLRLNNSAPDTEAEPPRHGEFWRINFSRVEWNVVVNSATAPQAQYITRSGQSDGLLRIIFTGVSTFCDRHPMCKQRAGAVEANMF
eukprot:8049926-Pyramimonas_sp.AAC.1